MRLPWNDVRRAVRAGGGRAGGDDKPGGDGGWPLAWHLAALCAAALAPVLVLEAALLLQVESTERVRQQSGARDSARRIAAMLDRELTAMGTLMEVLATSDYLRSGNAAAFLRRARHVPRPPGAEVMLSNAQGRVLADTGRANDGEEAPRSGGDDTSALTEPGTSFSGLAAGARGAASFSVSIAAPGPAGVGAYRLSLEVPLPWLGELLRTADVPAGMTASLTDRAGHILARTKDAERLVGTQIPAEMRMPSSEQQGWWRGRNALSEEVAMAFSRSFVSGWTVAVFMPEAAYAAPLRRSFLIGLTVAGLLALLTAALASLFARRIARPITALASLAAEPLRTSPSPLPGASSVREINEVSDALERARREALARLRDREDLLLTLDQAQVLVREPGGTILIWTSGSERLYGWTRAEAVGRVSHELLGTGFPRPLAEIEAELLSTGEWIGELRHRRRDGSTVAVISQWALRRDADGLPRVVVEASNDVSALRRTEGALRLQRDLLASVLNASAEPISARDLEGRFVVLNEPAAALLGTTASEALGRRPTDFPASGADELSRADADVIASGSSHSRESEIAGQEGAARVFVWSKAPWRDGSGRVVGVVTVSRDITARRRALQRLQQLQEEMLHVSRLSAMGALAAELAHELNQPLTAVANFADAARRLLATASAPETERLEAAREAMAEASAQAVHAGRIVRRLRDFIGRGEAERRPVALNQLVEEAVRLALTGSRNQGVELRLDLCSAAPTIVAERVQVQQVVFNLVRNAIEAMQGTARRVLRVATSTGAGAVDICVADTGPGIAFAVADQLFEPFQSTKPEGMGIGLSICRRIVEAHGGRIQIEETPGGGATFRLHLPLGSGPSVVKEHTADEP